MVARSARASSCRRTPAALAGEDGAYEALFDAYGVSRVESLDEMADTLALFAAGRRAGLGGLASVHDSGGERALMVDAAAEAGVPMAEISDETSARMAVAARSRSARREPARLLGYGQGRARDRHGVRPCAARGLVGVRTGVLGRPDLGGVPGHGLHRDGPGDVRRDREALRDAVELLERDRPERRELLDGDGIPVLEGTQTGLAAFRHLFEYRDFRARSPVEGASPVADEVRERWRERLANGEALDELEGLALLADFGVPVVASVRVDTLDDAIAAAEGIGCPVAVKTAAPGVQHKSDVGGVRLGVDDSPSLGLVRGS